MATYKYQLGTPPTDDRARELWLQHAAGFIIFQDARQYAIDAIELDLDAEAKAAALKGIDNAIYGLMMILDGVSGGLRNSEFLVHLKTSVRLSRYDATGKKTLVDEVDLFYRDGMCMGYHGWLDGDFGKVPVVTKTKHESPCAVIPLA